jgi:membrane peptidoglycan carboxypeptidase
MLNDEFPGIAAIPQAGRHAPEWHRRRSLKRKKLRRSNQQFSARDRASTQWVLLPTAFGLLAAAVVLASVLTAYTALAAATLRQYHQQIVTLPDILPRDNLKMYDEHGTLIYQAISQGLQTTVPLAEISPNLIQAEIATEDHSFWSNPGVDITGIVRAALADLTQGRIVEGGSTITQQLIKNAIVGNHETMIRKLREVILAPAITRRYGKQQILSMYLNTTFYGEHAYGAEAAAFTYFDLHDTPTRAAASQLDLAQAALLAGIPQALTALDPFLHPHAALVRMRQVLHAMQSQGYITPAQARAALIEARRPDFLHHGTIDNHLAPDFVTYALNELAQVLHVSLSDLPRSGLLVTTTLNVPLQQRLLKIAQQHILRLSASHHITDAAAVLINFRNGAIRTLIGNVHPNHDAFDVATQGYRQPGSSFKPFVYAAAFARGLSPGMPILDAPYAIPLCCGLPPYRPQNYDLRYHGLVSIRAALQNSFNIPAVKVLVKTGVQASLHTAQAMGITSYEGIPNDTMVLGSLGVHLLDETSAYGAFANGGVRLPPHAIQTVKDTQGRLLYHFVPEGHRVISQQVAFMMTNVLSDNQARAYEFGRCSALSLYSHTQAQCEQGNPGTVRPAAANTGTSQDFRDNWTVGYTTDYVLGVWAGNDNNSPMVNVTGVDGAGPIWHDGMVLAEQGRPVSQFPVPRGVERRTVHYPAGLTTTDWYIDGLPWTDWGLG